MKTMKKLLSVLLAALFVLPGLVSIGMTVGAMDFETGDLIQFGSYPQTKVTDVDQISALNVLTSVDSVWQSYNYYSGTSTVSISDSSIGYNNGSMTASDYMQYTDVTYEGEMYRGVRFMKYRPMKTGSTAEASRSCQDENGYTAGTTYWFLWEPLLWDVLDGDAGLVLCRTIIDSQPFNNYMFMDEDVQDVYGYNVEWGDVEGSFYANNYEKASIRSWMMDDGGFLSEAFTEEQQEKIYPTELDNSAYSRNRAAYNSTATTDKIFLLSFDDIQKARYGFSDNFARQAQGSDYAKCQGLYVNTSNKCSGWRLRTAGDNPGCICSVGNDGKFIDFKGNANNLAAGDTSYGFRPAMRLDLEYAYLTAEYKAKFVADGATVGTVKYTATTTSITPPDVPEKQGYTGAWPDYTLEVGGITVEAEYTPIIYTATFIADGKPVGTVDYTVETTSITPPDVPEKPGYTGKWADYTLEIDGITVYAEYAEETYFATFKANGQEVGKVEYTVSTTSITPPDVPEKLGYTGTWPDYTLPVGGTTVTAVYTPVIFSAQFVADGKLIGTVDYTVESTSISEPDVPEKLGYTGTWKPYTFEIGGMTVEALYTADIYTATFVADDKPVGTVDYTVETTSITPPDVPEKPGYSGKWADYTLAIGGVTVEAEYTPIPYTATFIADGKPVGTVDYTVETTSITPPDVPKKPGYTGKWADYTLAIGGITVVAQYTANDYIATFIADGKPVGTVGYTAETTSITPPDVPEKPGYSGKWADYTLEIGGITVEAEYTPITYTATFMADGKPVGTVDYTVVTTSITPPDVPKKPGYTGKWADYTLQIGGITIEAEYTPITYTATFVADGKPVDTVEYTVETATVTPPAVPAKEGYTGKWADYTLEIGGVTVNAVYTPITYAVTWIADGKQTQTSVTFGAAITTPSDPAKEGYSFDGWTPAIPDAMPAQDLTFTAIFTPNKYNAVLMANGKQIAVIPYTYGQKSIDLPDVPEVEGYTGAWPSYTLPVGGTTITAVYQKNSYTVTWDKGDSTIQTTVLFGEPIARPDDPIRMGYKFTGWTPAIPATMPARDLKFTAQYEKIVVVSLAITKLPTKTVYRYRLDQNIDLSGMVLEAVYSDGSKKTITDLSACTISGYAAKPRGDKIVTVGYEGKTAEFKVTVKYVWWQWLILIFLLGFIWY